MNIIGVKEIFSIDYLILMISKIESTADSGNIAVIIPA